MDLNRVPIAIRPRPSYEGLDLGFAMASRWFLTLWLLWLITAVPVALGVSALCYRHPFFGLLVIWWLKPLYETPILFWISRKIFGENPTVKAVASSLYSIVKPNLLLRLTIRRFSPARSFFMPVILLENLRGKDYATRTMVLGRRESAGFILTMICSLFELVLFLSVMILMAGLLPQSLLPFDLTDMLSVERPLAAAACNLVYTAAMSVIAPYYVVAGFALYLNRRTQLEAWDIELNFKRLRERLTRDKATVLRGLICVCTLSLLSFYLCPSQAAAVTKEEARNTIEKILDQEDFGKKETVTYWKLKSFEKEEKEPNESLIAFVDWLIKWLVLIARPLLWICGATLLILLVYLTAKYMGLWNPPGRKREFIPPEELFGLKLTRDSLPEDIPGEVLSLLDKGDVRGALSLLYRGTLYKLIYVCFLDIPASATEGECMRLVRKKRKGEESTFFRELTGIWQKTAYGHIPPDKDRIHDLCKAWSHFYAS